MKDRVAIWVPEGQLAGGLCAGHDQRPAQLVEARPGIGLGAVEA